MSFFWDEQEATVFLQQIRAGLRLDTGRATYRLDFIGNRGENSSLTEGSTPSVQRNAPASRPRQIETGITRLPGSSTSGSTKSPRKVVLEEVKAQLQVESGSDGRGAKRLSWSPRTAATC